jgi:DNA-binding response OmpR family regulator
MSAKSVILLVNSSRSNLELLAQQFGHAGYETLTAASLEELDQAIHGEERIALALVDISGFDQQVWQRCAELSKARTPYIVISPHRSPAVQRESMEHGASGLLVKPLEFKDLMEHVQGVIGV